MTRPALRQHYSVTDGTLITDAAGAIGASDTWVPTGSGTYTHESTDALDYDIGPALRFTVAKVSSNYGALTKAVNLNLSTATHITCAIWAGEMHASTGTTFTVYFITSTPGTADLRSITFTAQKPGWNFITRPISVASSSGVPNWAVIRQIRVRVAGANTINRDIAFGGLWYNARNRAKVCFSFDDGWVSALTAFNYAKTYDIPMSFGIIPSLLNDLAGSYMTTAQLATLASEPLAEICCHDVNRWADESLLTLGEEGFIEHIQEIQAFIRQYDRLGSRIAILPEGDYGLTQQGLWKSFLPTMRKLDWLCGRMVVPTTVEIPFIMNSQMGHGDTLLIPSVYSLSNTVSLANVKAMLDTTEQYGGNAFIYGHKLDAAAADITWAESDWEDLMIYAAQKRNQGGIDFMKISDWVLGQQGRVNRV